MTISSAIHSFFIYYDSAMKDITAQFFKEVPKELDRMGYYDWVSAKLKR